MRKNSVMAAHIPGTMHVDVDAESRSSKSKTQ